MIKVVLFDYGGVLFGPLPHPKVRQLATQLRGQGIRTGILSNTILTMPMVLQLLGGYRGFDPVVLSSKEKIAKPNPEIYRLAVKRSRVKPEEIIFIDNRERNLVPAQAMGMKVVLAKNSDQIVSDVKQILRSENGLEL